MTSSDQCRACRSLILPMTEREKVAQCRINQVTSRDMDQNHEQGEISSPISLSMFRSVRSKYQKRTHRHRDLIRKLDTVEKGQIETSKAITQLVTVETAMVESVNAQYERLRPSWMAWTQALILLVLSTAIIFYAASETVNVSSISYNVTSLHQDAQSERTIAFEDVIAHLSNPSRKQSDMLSVFNSALKRLRSANNTDAEANGFENGLGGQQLRTQISLGAGSAFFGAVIAWILTQVLAELHWKGKRKPRKASLTD